MKKMLKYEVPQLVSRKGLEVETTTLKWVFQLDDSKSLHEKWVFHQTSILNWLFRVPGEDFLSRIVPTNHPLRIIPGTWVSLWSLEPPYPYYEPHNFGFLWTQVNIHQTFHVPKMEVLSLIRLFWGWVFPYISLTYCLYRWVPPF